MFLSLTNPWAIGFWLSLGGTLAAYGAMESGNTMALFFASFFGACLVYAFAMALLVGATRRALPVRVGKWISIACSAVIGILALGVAVQVFQLFV
jgi:threonine/homoserine/homoserine lactone efflux protein